MQLVATFDIVISKIFKVQGKSLRLRNIGLKISDKICEQKEKQKRISEIVKNLWLN